MIWNYKLPKAIYICTQIILVCCQFKSIRSFYYVNFEALVWKYLGLTLDFSNMNHNVHNLRFILIPSLLIYSHPNFPQPLSIGRWTACCLSNKKNCTLYIAFRNGPVYAQLVPQNSAMLPACFTLKLSQPTLLCSGLAKLIYATTEVYNKKIHFILLK